MYLFRYPYPESHIIRTPHAPVQIIKVKDLIYPAQLDSLIKLQRKHEPSFDFGVKTSNTYILFLTKPFFLFLDIVFHETYIHLYSFIFVYKC